MQKALKTVVQSKLKAITSNVKGLEYRVDQKKLKQEKEVIITGPVKIIHPTDLILLPQIKSAGGQSVGEIWHLSATGGSGTFHWETDHPAVAAVKGQAYIRSNMAGATTLWLRDHKNPNNYDKIEVEVQVVQNFEWLESRIETAKENSSVVLSAIARDSRGRRFTNCSSLELDYHVKADGAVLLPGARHSSWDDLQAFVSDKNQMELIKLKEMFDRNPSAQFKDQLVQEKFTPAQYAVLAHNNFGICDQAFLRTDSEGGLTRVTASLRHNEKAESDQAEIAAFASLKTRGPSYQDFLKDLWSSDQAGQEFQSFDHFAPSFDPVSKRHKFIAAFGSSFELQLRGGSNYWKTFSGEYQTTWSVEKAASTGEDVLEIAVASQNRTNVSLSIKCQSPKALAKISQPHDYTVHVFQQNKVSRHHLQPIQHKESVTISCSPPAGERLLWSQESTTILAEERALLPRSRLLNDVRHHYVLTNSKYYVRSLMVDARGHCFLNHRSVRAEFSVSDASLAELSDSYSDAK